MCTTEHTRERRVYVAGYRVNVLSFFIQVILVIFEKRERWVQHSECARIYDWHHIRDYMVI